MVKTSTPGPQVEGQERCPTAGDPSTGSGQAGHQPFGNLRAGSKGRKASTPSQTESHVEQVAMDSESKGVSVRVVMDNRPTLANVCHKQAQAGPKRGRS
mgnify:CR=1 FL=1